MSVAFNKTLSPAVNLIALIAASNAAFAAQNWQPSWLVFNNEQVLTGTADGSNTSIDVAPQSDTSKTGGVLVRGPKKTITYTRGDVATLLAVDVSALAYTLDTTKDIVIPDDETQPIAFKDDATVLSSLVTALFGAEALVSEFALSYDTAGNQEPASGTTSVAHISVVPGALVFDPATAPIAVTLTWPAVAGSTGTIDTTNAGGFTG